MADKKTYQEVLNEVYSYGTIGKLREMIKDLPDEMPVCLLNTEAQEDGYDKEQCQVEEDGYSEFLVVYEMVENHYVSTEPKKYVNLKGETCEDKIFAMHF